MRIFLLGFLACYVIASLFYFLDDEADTNLMVSFIIPWVTVWFVISFIPCGIWRFVRLCFRPVRPDAMDYLKDAYVKRLFSEIYFCHDKKLRIG